MGSVDALIRPKPEGVFWKCLPKRYKLNGMLDPRPFYSKSGGDIYQNILIHGLDGI